MRGEGELCSDRRLHVCFLCPGGRQHSPHGKEKRQRSCLLNALRSLDADLVPYRMEYRSLCAVNSAKCPRAANFSLRAEKGSKEHRFRRFGPTRLHTLWGGGPRILGRHDDIGEFHHFFPFLFSRFLVYSYYHGERAEVILPSLTLNRRHGAQTVICILLFAFVLRLCVGTLYSNYFDITWYRTWALGFQDGFFDAYTRLDTGRYALDSPPRYLYCL